MRSPSVACPCASALWIAEVKAVLVGAETAPQIGTVSGWRPLNYWGNWRHNVLLTSFWYTLGKTLNDLSPYEVLLSRPVHNNNHSTSIHRPGNELYTQSCDDVRGEPEYSITWSPNKVRVLLWRNGKPQLPLTSSLREISYDVSCDWSALTNSGKFLGTYLSCVHTCTCV